MGRATRRCPAGVRMKQATDAPVLVVKPALHPGASDGGTLNIGWRIENQSTDAVEIVESWCPHSGFFAARASVRPPMRLQAGECGCLQRDVRCGAGLGEAVENAFFIALVRYCGSIWRVLTRVRVAAGADSRATLQVEATTAHLVGFAASASERQPFA